MKVFAISKKEATKRCLNILIETILEVTVRLGLPLVCALMVNKYEIKSHEAVLRTRFAVVSQIDIYSYVFGEKDIRDTGHYKGAVVTEEFKPLTDEEVFMEYLGFFIQISNQYIQQP